MHVYVNIYHIFTHHTYTHTHAYAHTHTHTHTCTFTRKERNAEGTYATTNKADEECEKTSNTLKQLMGNSSVSPSPYLFFFFLFKKCVNI
jgi:hypothetical protein